MSLFLFGCADGPRFSDLDARAHRRDFIVDRVTLPDSFYKFLALVEDGEKIDPCYMWSIAQIMATYNENFLYVGILHVTDGPQRNIPGNILGFPTGFFHACWWVIINHHANAARAIDLEVFPSFLRSLDSPRELFVSRVILLFFDTAGQCAARETDDGDEDGGQKNVATHHEPFLLVTLRCV